MALVRLLRSSRGALPLLSTLRRESSAASMLEAATRLAQEFPGDFTLQYPPRREFFKEFFSTSNGPSFAHQVVSDPLTHLTSDYHKQIMLYFHVPFCEHKCSYCNFAVDIRNNRYLHEEYVDHLIAGAGHFREFLLRSNPDQISIPGIDIGGGTPTLLEAATLTRFLNALRPLRDSCTLPRPLSIETTPAIASSHLERLYALKEGGVDRISMGLQSTNDGLLGSLNRGKEASLSVRAVENIQRVGFDRFSVDIIFGLPGQTMELWQSDLQRIVDLGIDTVTTYDCLYRGKGRSMTKSVVRPSSETYGQFYDYAFEFLTSHGFNAQYGSVNFTKHKGETGTSAYFEGRLLDGLQFFGIGNYATSTFGDKWWFAPHGVDQWMDLVSTHKEGGDDWTRAARYLPLGDCYTLPIEERAAKYLLLSLSFGIIDPVRYQYIFQEDIHQRFSFALSFAVEAGWMRFEASSGKYVIEKGHFKDMPQLRSLFYSSKAIHWLKNVSEHPVDQFRHRILQKLRDKRESTFL